MIRFFDLFISIFALIFSLPVSLAITFVNLFVTSGRPFFTQKRVGLNGVLFSLIKFRTMYPNSELKGLITIGNKDSRVTKFGYFLRKYKLDEIPQFWNVIKGEMSLVGPRPELFEYVRLYTEEQKEVFVVKPGITDYASLEYINESEVLLKSSDPQKAYLEEIMPHKIELNKKFITNPSLANYFKILYLTLRGVFFK